MATDPNGQRRHVKGEPPWFDDLAGVVEPASDLLDELFTEFAPVDAALATRASRWLSFHTWVVDKLVGEELQGTAPDDQRARLWVIYASSYWSMLELTLNFGVPPAVINLGMQPVEPSADSVADFVAKTSARRSVLGGGGGAALEVLPALLREEPCTGMMHGTAYNSGYCEVICEKPPLGELPAHLDVETGSIRVNPRDLMRIDYAIPVPPWLSEWRTAFEISMRRDPDAFERAIAGDGSEKDLRAIWREALEWGHHNWGGASLNEWSQPYYDDVRYWSLAYTFGLEGISLATLVALVDRDETAAFRAVRGNALYLGSWGAAVMGLLDTGGTLPEVVPG